MKKVMMLVFAAAVAAAGVGGVNAAEPALNFDGRGGAASIAVPEAGAPQIIPGRTFQGAYDFNDVAKMDRVLDKTIANAEKNNSPEVVAGLKCLRKSGTPKQKAAFVYATGTYALPEVCEAGVKTQKGIVDDIVDCVLETVCTVIMETVIKWACDEEGKCMYQPVEVLRETCREICK